MAYKYVDVSRYNNTIDWERVKRSGIDGAWLKTVSTNYSSFGGLYIDPTFERNYRECKRVGIPVGVYYYTYAQDKRYRDKELALFKKAIAGKSFELPLVIDVEDNLLKPLSATALTDLVIYAAKEIESWGAYRMVYTYLNYSNTELEMARIYAEFDVWMARYIAKKPAGQYGAWQYTSKGTVDGIRGNVDLSHVYKDYPTIIKNAGLNDFTGVIPTPQPSVKPLSGDPIRLEIGFASPGDISVIRKMLNDLEIDFTVQDGYIITRVSVSAGDQVTILTKCKELSIPCVEYVEKIVPISPTPIRLVIGPCSEEALKPLEKLILDLEIENEIDDGFIYTEQVSSGDQVFILRKAKQYGVEVKEYVSVVIHSDDLLDVTEPGVDIEPEPTPEPDPDEEIVIKKSALVAFIEFLLRLFKGGK